MDQQTTEHLIKMSEKVARTEKKYVSAKLDLEILKAQYILKNDWESVLGKSKPTQKEKDAYILLGTEEQQRIVNDLKLQVDYCKRCHEIQIMKQKY